MAGRQSTSPDVSPQAVPIYVSNKNSAETVRCGLSTFRGHRLADIRVWVEREHGQFVPTRKGIALSVDLLPDLAEAIQLLQEAVKEAAA